MGRVSRAVIGALLAGGLGCGHAEEFSGDRPDPSRLVGIACDADADCEQSCVRDQRRFPDGFCTLVGCRSNTDCPDGTVCVRNDDGICVFPCGSPLDCTASFLGRAGYTCLSASGFSSEGTSNVLYRVCMGD